MGKKSMKHKKQHKNKKLPEPGTYKYGMMTRQNPVEFYHSYLERLKYKRAMKREEKLKHKHE